jgi:hypothetical protein
MENNEKIKLANGEYADADKLYYQSNRVLMDSYTKALEEDRDADAEAILHYILNRFEYDSCQKNGETKDELFARQFGNFVNGKMGSAKAVAQKMSCEHRYLQNEMFHVCMEYIKILAENASKGWFDPRNEYAAKTSQKIIDMFKETNYPY